MDSIFKLKFLTIHVVERYFFLMHAYMSQSEGHLGDVQTTQIEGCIVVCVMMHYHSSMTI